MRPEAILRHQTDRWLAASLTPLGGDNRTHIRHHQPQKPTVRESGVALGLTRGSAPSTPKGPAPGRARSRTTGLAAMANHGFADRRRTAMGAYVGEVREAAPLLEALVRCEYGSRRAP